MRMEFLREKARPGYCASARSCPTGSLRWLRSSALGAGEITLSEYVVLVAEGVVRPDVR